MRKFKYQFYYLMANLGDKYFTMIHFIVNIGIKELDSANNNIGYWTRLYAKEVNK